MKKVNMRFMNNFLTLQDWIVEKASKDDYLKTLYMLIMEKYMRFSIRYTCSNILTRWYWKGKTYRKLVSMKSLVDIALPIEHKFECNFSEETANILINQFRNLNESLSSLCQK